MSNNILNQEHRNFLQTVNQAAFNNPFSPETVNTKLQIAESRGMIDDDTLNSRVLHHLQSRLQQIEHTPAHRNNRFDDREQRLLENAQLYCIYLRYQQKFDAFIEDQIKSGDEPIVLPFAQDLLAAIKQLGFDQEETNKYLCLFYQTRRAYRFIGQAIMGKSPCMQTLRKHLWNNLFTFDSHWYLSYFCEHMEEFSTLLLGDTGTGKSRIAQAIGHSNYIPFDIKKQRYAESFTRSFQSINLSQFPSSLLEAELFGHKKGAFTGAIENRPGLFARCSMHGAVFIDEVGEIDQTIQVKLLTVLQDRVFSAVGSSSEQRFEGRVIAATNRNLKKLVDEGKFREDFYYRLCSDLIRIPTLCQRLNEQADELHLLITNILERTIGTSDENLIDTVETRLQKKIPHGYNWPGNVRELEQCVRSICLTGSYTPLLKQNKDLTNNLNLPNKPMTAQQLMQLYCHTLYQQNGSYEKVARITELDRRTAKKYIQGYSESELL